MRSFAHMHEQLPRVAERKKSAPSVSRALRPVQAKRAIDTGYGDLIAAARAPVREAVVHGLAEEGTAGPAEALPHRNAIQASFGHYDISSIAAHTDGRAAEAVAAMGAKAFATGNHVAFAGAPSLHTAAHEAAHVVQQRGGVKLEGGVGAEGDVYERHADAVADRVVAGLPSEHLLDAMAPRGAASGERAVQGIFVGELEKCVDGYIVQKLWENGDKRGYAERRKAVEAARADQARTYTTLGALLGALTPKGGAPVPAASTERPAETERGASSLPSTGTETTTASGTRRESPTITSVSSSAPTSTARSGQAPKPEIQEGSTSSIVSSMARSGQESGQEMWVGATSSSTSSTAMSRGSGVPVRAEPSRPAADQRNVPREAQAVLRAFQSTGLLVTSLQTSDFMGRAKDDLVNFVRNVVGERQGVKTGTAGTTIDTDALTEEQLEHPTINWSLAHTDLVANYFQMANGTGAVDLDAGLPITTKRSLAPIADPARIGDKFLSNSPSGLSFGKDASSSSSSGSLKDKPVYTQAAGTTKLANLLEAETKWQKKNQAKPGQNTEIKTLGYGPKAIVGFLATFIDRDRAIIQRAVDQMKTDHAEFPVFTWVIEGDATKGRRTVLQYVETIRRQTSQSSQATSAGGPKS